MKQKEEAQPSGAQLYEMIAKTKQQLEIALGQVTATVTGIIKTE